MVKNDNIDVTQRPPLNLDDIFGLLHDFLRVCEVTFFNSAIPTVFFCFCVVLLSEHEVSRAIVLFELCERFSLNREICVSLHRKTGTGSKNLVDRRRGGRRDESLRNGSW